MMKVVKEVVEKTQETATFSLRLKKAMIKELDTVKSKHGVSRNRLVEAILEQVLADKTFVLRLKE